MICQRHLAYFIVRSLPKPFSQRIQQSANVFAQHLTQSILAEASLGFLTIAPCQEDVLVDSYRMLTFFLSRGLMETAPNRLVLGLNLLHTQWRCDKGTRVRRRYEWAGI
mmetsp:Transcript_24550/g.57202  ORF Transcript_24550/g.57202 Transcript_24550/m.57202 type:complete len:109 (+) Transcript_24550:1226-1552(+)